MACQYVRFLNDKHQKAFLEEFKTLGYPLYLGLSRKSFLGMKDEDNDLKDALTLAVSYPLIKKGIDYLRVHNVKLHRELLNSVI